MDEPPLLFGRDFLRWFQHRTEDSWCTYPKSEQAISGFDWQAGTRWLDGLSEQEIGTIEQRWEFPFPPDYRLFLRMLHTVDRPALDIDYLNGKTATAKTCSAFFSWQDDPLVIQKVLDEPFVGLLSAIERGPLWLPSWGKRLTTPEMRVERVRSFLKNAPHLIPLWGHVYLLAEPCSLGNPVFSLVGSDIVLFGRDLRQFFLFFSDILDHLASKADEDEETYQPPQLRDPISSEELQAISQAVPFWGELLIPSSDWYFQD